jgi:hypothetical protein
VVKVGEGNPTEWNHWHEIAIDNEEYNRFVIIRFGDTWILAKIPLPPQ